MKTNKYRESRDQAKKKYYSNSQYRASHHRYTSREDDLILSKAIPDSELADLLSVSVKGIHNRRARLKQIQIFKTQVW